MTIVWYWIVLVCVFLLPIVKMFLISSGFARRASLKHLKVQTSRCYVSPTTVLFSSSDGDKESISKQQNKNKGQGKSKVTEAPPVQQSLEELRQVRIQKMKELEKLGHNPFAYKFNPTHSANELHGQCKHIENSGEDQTIKVSFAGRVMLRRFFGKLAFFTLQDDAGSIQLYIDQPQLQEEFNKLRDFTDAGDIIGVHGYMKRTGKGELSIFVQSWEMLTKALQPLPDKYHGLSDINKRYRQRHVDMIVNSHVKDTFRTRAKIISLIRQQLDNQGYLEIETPILHSQPGGAEAKPFTTYHNTLDMPLSLRIATELHLKRLIVGGFPKVYDIGRIFRNEGLSTRHNPEFTSIELYQAYADYHTMMNLTEDLVCNIIKAIPSITAKTNITNSNVAADTTNSHSPEGIEEISETLIIPYQGQLINMTKPWRRVSMIDLVKDACGMDFTPYFTASSSFTDYEALRRNALQEIELYTRITPSVKQLLQEKRTVGEMLNVLFEEYCEKNLIQPTFVMNHPIDISPLAKPHRDFPGLTERFELFIVGREHANAFSELTDPIDQRERFNKQVGLHMYMMMNDVVCVLTNVFWFVLC
jgi:lysyl-tRNA synthetase class 2